MSRRKQLNPKAIKVDEDFVEDSLIAEEMSLPVYIRDRRGEDSEDDRLFINEASHSPHETSSTFHEQNLEDIINNSSSSNNNSNNMSNILNVSTFYLDSIIKVEPGFLTSFTPMQNNNNNNNNIQDGSFISIGQFHKNSTSKSRRKSDRILPLPTCDGCDNFKCPICGDILISNHELTKHIRSHNSPSEVAPTLNSCKICGKILSSMSSLDRHMLVHSGERPFQCRICNMAFTTNGNMHRHMRIHAKDQEVTDHGFFKDGVVYKPPKKKRYSENISEVPSKKGRVSQVFNGDFAEEKHQRDVLHHQTSQTPSSEFYMRQPIQQSNEEEIKINPAKEKYFCTCCELSLYSLYGLMEHLSDHDSTFESSKPDEVTLRYECLPCHCTFQVLSELESHLVEKHSDVAVGLKLCPFNGKNLSERLKADFLKQTDESKRYEVDAFEITSEKFSLTSASQTSEIDNNNNKNIFHVSNDDVQQQHRKNLFARNGFDVPATFSESQDASQVSEASFVDFGNSRSTTSLSSCPRCPGMSFLCLRERRLHELLCHVTEKIVGGWCLEEEREISDPREDMDQREFMLILGLDSLARKMIVHHRKGLKFKESLGDHRILPAPVTMELGECKRELFDHNHEGAKMLARTAASPNLQMFLSPSSEVQATFRCPECPFTCGENILLYKHERMHRTERFYKCLKCSQTFTTKANCERHLRKKHLVMTRDEMEKLSQLVKSSNPDDDPSSCSPRPAETVCKYCGEDFKMERALKHHLRSQSSCQHKPYTCQVCGTGFSTKANCLRHIQKQHSDLQPYEAHMKVNLELIEAQKKVKNHMNVGLDLELKKGDGGFDLLPSRALQSLILGPAGRDNPKKQTPFESTSILDLRQMATNEMEASSDEPLDFSFKKEELGIFPKPELRPKTDSPVDLSLKKPSTPKQAFLSGNSLFTARPSKHFPYKTSYVNLKSILKPFQATVSQNNSSPKESPKHFNPRTNRFHCPVCGAIFKQSEKLQSHLLTHNLALSSSDVAPSSSPPSLSSSSSILSSSPFVQSSIVRKTEHNSADFEEGKNNNNNNNSPSCKNANTSNETHHQNNLLSIPFSSLSSSFRPPPSSSSSFPIAQIMSNLMMGAPTAVGSTLRKGGLNERRFRLSASSFNQRLKLNMSNGRKNSYSDSPHKLKCHFCPRAFPWISSLKRHLLTHTGHKPFKCVKCMVTFSTKSNRERHMMRKHGINIRDQSLGQMLDQCYNCHLCDSLPFGSLDMLLEHHKEFHAHSGSVLDLPPPLVIKPQEEDAEDVSDSIQMTNTSNIDEVELTQDPATSLMLYGDPNTLLNILAAKAKSTPVIMGHSSLAFKNSQHVNPERDNYNVDKITRCWKCDLLFECRKGLLRHLKEHNVDLPYKCYLCDASYDTRMDSLQHKISAHPQDWLSIKEKNKVSDDVLKYSDFMDKIVEETLAGNLQGRRIMTSSQDGLDLDLRPETDYAQRKVFCTLCPKRFWSLQDLRRHMRSHTGERPFECDVCQARFTLKHSMMRHRRKHQSPTVENSNFYSNLSNNSMATDNDCNVVDYDELGEDEVEGESFMDSRQYEAEANCNEGSKFAGAELNAEDQVDEFMEDDDCDDEDENDELVIDEDVHHQVGEDGIIQGEA